MNVYIPKPIYEKVLSELPKRKKHKIPDRALYLIHSIIVRAGKMSKMELELSKGFSTMNAKVMQQVVSDYEKYIGWLCEENIINSNRSYSNFTNNKFSIGYKIQPNYEGELVTHKLTNKIVLRNINKSFERRKKEQIQQDEKYPSLRKWLNPSLRINETEAAEFLANYKVLNPDTEQSKINDWLRDIKKINDGVWSFKVSNKVNRLTTNIVNLKSELRSFLSYNAVPFVKIDLANAQPFMSRIFLNSDLYISLKGERLVKLYKPTAGEYYFKNLRELIKSLEHEKDVLQYNNYTLNNTLYDVLGTSLIGNDKVSKKEIRKIGKDGFMKGNFSPNQLIGTRPSMKAMKKLFPSVYKIFSFIRKNMKGESKCHCALPSALQKLESIIILDTIANRISNNIPDAPIYTIHDCIMTTEPFGEAVKKIIFDVMSESFGCCPEVEIEKLEHNRECCSVRGYL